MRLLDEEVFAVIMALVVVGSVLAAATVARQDYVAVYNASATPPRFEGYRSLGVVAEGFTAIGLLNEHCKIGEYPQVVFLGERLPLCIYLFNYEGEPLVMQVRFKIVANTTEMPTNTTPSPAPVLAEYTRALYHNQSALIHVRVPIEAPPSLVGGNVTLVFELWTLNPETGNWTYTGRWVHLHARLQVLPGAGG